MSEKTNKHFIEHLIDKDLDEGFSSTNLRFRFPPEPNGYLHIGHVKAICINFGLGKTYNAPVNLRFDDTNPTKEEQHFVDAIKRDISWLGYQWDKECYASDYFQTLFEWAIILIEKGLAYVDSQESLLIAEQKGTPTQAGTLSPYRSRSKEENKALFLEMKQGKHGEGTHVLRAKGDMTSSNMLMRDPILYRILFTSHHRTKKQWCIYPMYDWTHGQSDYIESVSHSLCSLEFQPHRDLYDWFLDHLYSKGVRPKQREFARLNLNYTITSKRKLLRLIEHQLVQGWDDPRMPTISGLRRRGYTPQSLRKFATTAGVSKRENIIDVSLLEFCVREDLNKIAPRVMVVLNPVKLIITNYPSDQTEQLIAENNPEDANSGYRSLPFTKVLYIEREDFKEEANRKFFRLTLNKEVRLKNAYIIKGQSVIKDNNGNIIEIHCTYDPDSKSGSGSMASQRKVKGTLHWVSVNHSFPVEIRNYDRLFHTPNPEADKEIDYISHINPHSLNVIEAYAEPSLKKAKPLTHFQFQRQGYYVVDSDSTEKKIVFNRTVGLRDNWIKQQS